jgi:ABC-2 type transport system permease protein
MRRLIEAEIIKLTRQRAALFWGFLFLPIFKTFITLALVGVGPPPLATGHAADAIQPLHFAARALAIGGNPIAQLFYAVGAAAIFAVEYRHSGWRHIVPRASRWTLIIAKFANFALFAAISLALVALGDLTVTVVLPLLRGSSPSIADLNLASAGMVALALLISLAELTVLAGLVAFVAVATRSAIGAIIAPFLLSLSATMAESYLSGAGDSALVPLPTFAGDALRHWLADGAGAPAFSHAAMLGAATLLVWAAASIGATIMLFSRQDLVSE